MNRENKRKTFEKGYYKTHACRDAFTCKVCGRLCTPENAGSQHRNHCPNCLSSLHVDVEPGDRASDCGGIMEPVAVWVRRDGEWAVIHRCRRCGALHSNRTAADDNPMKLMSIAMRPLCQPPFPLERIREIRASERRAYQKIADVFEQCSYDYDKNSDTTKAFYAFVQNKLHYAVTGKTAAELISERATLDSPTMGLTTWKGAPDGKILKSDTLVAKNYLNEKELSRLNRLVTMFIDYAELMAEDEQLMSMQDWLNETDRFLTNNRRKVLDGKGHISREAAAKKVGAIYDEFRKKQDAEYISEFDRQTEKYLKGE